MNRLELKESLKKPTPHEIRYKCGQMDHVEQSFEHRILHGKDVLYAPIKSSSVFKHGPLFSVKKHSRYHSFPEHVHDGIEINYMYSGSCWQVVNGKRCQLDEGQVLFLNRDTSHSIEPLSDDDILLNININTDYLISNFLTRFACESVLTRFLVNAITDSIQHDTHLLFHSEGNERLQLYFEDLLCQWYDPSIVARDIIENLMSLILSELVLAYEDTCEMGNRRGELPTVAVLRYIAENYQTCTLSSAARMFNMNPNYLSNCLKRQTGHSYRELVQIQRMSVAEQLLRTSELSVSEIIHAAGYENITFFYKKFQERNNCLPNEYRFLCKASING